MGIDGARRHPLLLAAVALAVLTFAVTLATPYLPLPVGTATATGESMGHDGMRVLVYLHPALTGIEVGDAVVFRTGEGYVHHRVVAATGRGYATRGDAVSVTDQAQGLPYATHENVVGVVVANVALATVWLVGAGAAALLVGLSALARWTDRAAGG